MVARLAKLSIRELAKLEAAIDRELVSRNFMPRLDDMVGSYTEELVCHELGLERLPPETKVIDAKDRNGKQYQIKGTRSRTPHSVKLGKLNLPGMIMVDFAVGVVFQTISRWGVPSWCPMTCYVFTTAHRTPNLRYLTHS